MTKLTFSSFINYYILHPLAEELSSVDQTKAMVGTVAFAVLFSFTPHMYAYFTPLKKKYKAADSNFLNPEESNVQNVGLSRIPSGDHSAQLPVANGHEGNSHGQQGASVLSKLEKKGLNNQVPDLSTPIDSRKITEKDDSLNRPSSRSKITLPLDKAKQRNLIDHPLDKAKQRSLIDHPLDKAKQRSLIDHPLDKAKQRNLIDHPLDKAKQRNLIDHPLDKAKQRNLIDHPLDKAKQRNLIDHPLDKAKQKNLEEQIPSRPNSSLSYSDWELLDGLMELRIKEAERGIQEKLLQAKQFIDLQFEMAFTSRQVARLETADNKCVLYAKLLSISPMGLREQGMMNDALAFFVDQVFNFGVVPPTMLVTKSKKKYKLIAESILKMEFPFILQESVETSKNSLQTESERSSLDIRQIQKAILFNVIANRQDARFCNTVADKNGKIFEIDNEQAFEKTQTDSWLTQAYADLVFDSDIMFNFINTPKARLESAFDLFESNYETTIAPETKAIVLDNFARLCDFCKTNGVEGITVGQLVAISQPVRTIELGRNLRESGTEDLSKAVLLM